MKKATAILAAMVLVVSLVSLAVAADTMKGTVKSVDAKAGMIVLTTDSGKDESLTADNSVDLGKVKAGDKVEASVEKNVVKSMKAAGAAEAAAPAKRKNKSAVGC
jgi:hypothetical protein